MGSPYDFHIHTSYLRCANETMTVPALVRRCETLGLQTIAITDHLNAPQFLAEHFHIKDDLVALDSPLEIIFGVEVNVIDKDTGAVSICQQEIGRAGFELVIGGVHGCYHDRPDRRSIVGLQHRLMLQVIANPLVDVLVHPWWFGGSEMQPGGPMEWFRDLSEIPDDYVRELGEAAAAHGTAIEANGSAIWTNGHYTDTFKTEYADYMAALAAAGARISIASDAHDIGQLESVHLVADILAGKGVTGGKLWRPEPA
jgi:histidinol phosphatase-like PHP family hydrolase